MEANEVDPYAPPKSAANGTENTTYLDQDGYAFNNELVANKHFKSPLICAKLGIPIKPESLPEARFITVTRTARVSRFLNYFISVLATFIIVIIAVAIDSDYLTPAILVYLILSSVINRILTKPYQIPFYFSDQYTRIRKNRILIFSIILFILAITLAYGIIAKRGEPIAFSILAGILTFIFYKFKTTYFVVTETKGEFHYIRGVHTGLLEALPYLPISH